VTYYCGYSWVYIDRTVPSYPRYAFVKHVGVSGSHYHYDYSTSVESISGRTYYCYDFPTQ
jgi:hypothetical protein